MGRDMMDEVCLGDSSWLSSFLLPFWLAHSFYFDELYSPLKSIPRAPFHPQVVHRSS